MTFLGSDLSSVIEATANGSGARVGDNRVTYCVWAPKHSRVAVRIQRPDQRVETIEMQPQANGFFSVDDALGKAGDRYLFELSDGSALPDPASRFQPEGVHGWSQCIDPRTYTWRSTSWQRPGWHGQSIYELHVGTFTAHGSYCSAMQRLDHLAALGVEAIEIMPLADFPGERNWGYDGVALYAPARCYGSPDELRALVDAAHERGLAVILDVVYNHLGPDGNYLARFSDSYFHAERDTPWGVGFNLDGPDSGPVREYILRNAAYWLDEYRFDGLRLDATHHIRDDSPRHLLAELSDLAHERGAFVVAEDERNTCELLYREDGRGNHLDAVWADDFHHQMRVALTGVQEGYFQGYTGSAKDLAAVLEQGWFYTGQPYPAWKGRARGESCRHLPVSAFVTCIENHDQVGNRARGERLEHLIGPSAFRAASALLCLAPYPPLIFMGQEWGASAPFLFFTDHAGELGRQVSVGRQKEFAAAGINQRVTHEEVPDPQRLETFLRSKLCWEELRQRSHARVLAVYRRCLAYRSTWLRGRALERDAWHVSAHDRVIALRYQSSDQPARLVVTALHGSVHLDLMTHPRLQPPDGHSWLLEFDSSAIYPDTDGFGSLISGRTDLITPSQIETLVFRAPATVLLVAKPKTSKGDPS